MNLDGTARDSKVEVGQAERAINTQLSNEENCRIILTRKEIEYVESSTNSNRYK